MKLMSDWKLMDELGVLRAIYLLGSGILSDQACPFISLYIIFGHDK